MWRQQADHLDTQVNNTLYISGQIGFVPETMEVIKGGVVPEARQALTNMGHILEAANCTFDNVVKTTVLLADINDFAAVNEEYTKFFSDNYPARAAYQVQTNKILTMSRHKTTDPVCPCPDIYVILSCRWPPYHAGPGWR